MTAGEPVGIGPCMADNDRDQKPDVAPPPPADRAPSATGVVAGDKDELREAPPSKTGD